MPKSGSHFQRFLQALGARPEALEALPSQANCQELFRQAPTRLEGKDGKGSLTVSYLLTFASFFYNIRLNSA